MASDEEIARKVLEVRERMLAAWPNDMSMFLEQYVPMVVGDFCRAHGCKRARIFFEAMIDYVELRGMPPAKKPDA